MYAILAGAVGKLDSRKVFHRFDGKCFKCSKPLVFATRGAKDYAIDHTLPVSHFWPITSENATLLCKKGNGEKSDRWPSEYYSKEELQHLSVLTAVPFEVLGGRPVLNPEAVQLIRANVDAFLAQYIRYPREIRRVRELILQKEGIDIKDAARAWPPFSD